MELVYLWVEDYKNIKKQGFNFSPRFQCEYDGETLTIDENDDYIPDFFGENINVTAIVGKNGSGKSSLLELILDIKHWSTSSKKVFYIVTDGTNLILHRLGFDNDISCNQNIISRYKAHWGAPIRDIGVNLIYLSLTPFLHNINTFYSNTGVKFFSIYNYIDDSKNHNFNFDEFYLALIPKIMDTLENKFIRKFLEQNSKPTCLTFKLTEEQEKTFPRPFSDVLKCSEEMPNYKDKYFRFITQKNITDFKYIKELMKLMKAKRTKLTLDIFEEEGNSLLNDIDGPIQKVDELYGSSYDKIRTNNDEKIREEVYASAEQDFITNENKHNKKINTLKEMLKRLTPIKFYFAKNEFSKETFFFSSGELVILFYINKLLEISKFEENITLLIDESELYLHPDWQKKFIDLLCNLLTHQTYKRNIVITSHSPFLISDIPKESVIFMKDGKQVKGSDKKQTFGANIHTLLSDSFFMEDGLMGEFAKNKIDKVITILNQEKLNKEDLKYCEKIIPIIGEPIVKNQLQKMFDSKKLGEIDKIQEEIAELQSRLKDLEVKDDKK